jgi:hypothetical protein
MSISNSPDFERIRNNERFRLYLPGFKSIINHNLKKQIETGQIPQGTNEGDTEQFAKGYDRLKTWLLLSNESLFWNPETDTYREIRNLSRINVPNAKAFCLAAFIICFQVFGDGNHDSAQYYFQSKTNRPLTPLEIEDIHKFCSRIGYDGWINNDDESNVQNLESAVENLSSTFISKMGGKKHKKRHSSRKKTKRKLKIKSRKYKYRKSGRR